MNFRNMITPEEYLEAAFLKRYAANELLDRLQWMIINPKWIINIGYTQELIVKLQSRFLEAHIAEVEFDERILNIMQSSASRIFADIFQLPIKLQSINLIFANLILPWCHDISQFLKELHRIMQTEAVIMLSTLGLDTMKECREIFSPDVMPQLMDMHDLGDLLVQVGFSDPVIDVDYVTITYQDATRLSKDLFASGMINLSLDEIEQAVLKLPKNAEGKWTLTYELIFAHAFCPERFSTKLEDGTVKIPLSQIKRQIKKS